jgi:hypothetical protein
MYGDVFGNRLADTAHGGEDCSDSQISWDPVRTPVARRRTGRTNEQYGYDPWTKTSYRLDRGLKWWCFKPGSVIWHASMQYTLGSVLFVAASCFSLLVSVRENSMLDRCVPLCHSVWRMAVQHDLSNIVNVGRACHT